MADRLRREADPPSGMLASPVPQYWREDIQDYEKVQGAHGATRTILYGPNGEPIGTQDDALKVTLSGHIVPDVIYDLDTNARSINAGATIDLGVYELPATHRKYQCSIRGIGMANIKLLVGFSQSSNITYASNGNSVARLAPELRKRSTSGSPGGTDYELWTGGLPALGRYMHVQVNNASETESSQIRLSLVTLEPTMGV